MMISVARRAPRRIILSVMIAFVGTSPALVKGEGLYRKLPEDGASCRYELELKVIAENGKVESIRHGEFTISAVGHRKADPVNERWIELKKTVQIADQTEFSEWVKFLVPEDDSSLKVNPIENAISVWTTSAQSSDARRPQPGRPVDLSGGKQKRQNLSRTFATEILAPPEGANQLKAKKIQFKQRTLECTGTSGEMFLPFERGQLGGLRFTSQSYQHDDVPFGTVEHRCQETRVGADGKQSGKVRVWTYRLIDVAVNATSELPAVK